MYWRFCFRCGSFHFDARRLDDWPPFLNLGFVVSAERFRCLLLARINLLPEVGEPLAYGGIGKAFDNCFIEFADDVFWRAFRYPHPMPNRQVELWQSGLVDCGDVWR